MHYQVYPCTNRAPADYIVLSSGLGGHAAFWQPQISSLQQHFHVVVYDQEGCHQHSPLLNAEYSMTDMAMQLLDILKQQQIQRFHLVGHALGALIGFELARLLAPFGIQLLSLTAVNAWDRVDPHSLKCFQARIQLLKYAGAPAYVQAQALFLYPPAWISEHHQQLEQQEQQQVQNFPPTENVLARIAALQAFELQQTHVRALAQSRIYLIATRDDFLVPVQKSYDLQKRLPQADLIVLPIGAHACTVTQAPEFNQLMLSLLLPAMA
jgi:aminoacrylate hydrolase